MVASPTDLMEYVSMSEQAFDARGREWLIPPCMKELRVADDEQRVVRNPDFRVRTDTDFEIVSYGQGGDGDMIVTCLGKDECAGGSLSVDRHDILQDRMPETTIAFRSICTARRMFYSDHGFIKDFKVLDD